MFRASQVPHNRTKASLVIPGNVTKIQPACVWSSTEDNQLHYLCCWSVVWVGHLGPNVWTEYVVCISQVRLSLTDRWAESKLRRTLLRPLAACYWFHVEDHHLWWELSHRVQSWSEAAVIKNKDASISTTEKDTKEPQLNHACHFFDNHGIVDRKFIFIDQSVNRKLYCDILKRLSKEIRRKSPDFFSKMKWILHSDNVPRHWALLIGECLAKGNIISLSQPRSDLAPADYRLFLVMKIYFKRCHFKSRNQERFAKGPWLSYGNLFTDRIQKVTRTSR